MKGNLGDTRNNRDFPLIRHFQCFQGFKGSVNINVAVLF